MYVRIRTYHGGVCLKLLPESLGQPSDNVASQRHHHHIAVLADHLHAHMYICSMCVCVWFFFVLAMQFSCYSKLSGGATFSITIRMP